MTGLEQSREARSQQFGQGDRADCDCRRFADVLPAHAGPARCVDKDSNDGACDQDVRAHALHSAQGVGHCTFFAKQKPIAVHGTSKTIGAAPCRH